ncbi:hypothetical protein ACDQ55_13680 [Chitinophaga sp. 30R24]|uniref:hypothetical protein n=1 Tax=Chitinophaga sp. 30R24 TaxID=3248838 RepID=UPI003B9052CE
MKKVAFVLCLCTLAAILACIEKTADRRSAPARKPSELPVYLITLEKFQEEAPMPLSAQSYVHQPAQILFRKMKDAMNLVFFFTRITVANTNSKYILTH